MSLAWKGEMDTLYDSEDKDLIYAFVSFCLCHFVEKINGIDIVI
jgi:hypothetical protein